MAGASTPSTTPSPTTPSGAAAAASAGAGAAPLSAEQQWFEDDALRPNGLSWAEWDQRRMQDRAKAWATNPRYGEHFWMTGDAGRRGQAQRQAAAAKHAQQHPKPTAKQWDMFTGKAEAAAAAAPAIDYPSRIDAHGQQLRETVTVPEGGWV
jgi:hypothetical protein